MQNACHPCLTFLSKILQTRSCRLHWHKKPCSFTLHLFGSCLLISCRRLLENIQCGILTTFIPMEGWDSMLINRLLYVDKKILETQPVRSCC